MLTTNISELIRCILGGKLWNVINLDEYTLTFLYFFVNRFAIWMFCFGAAIVGAGATATATAAAAVAAVITAIGALEPMFTVELLQ